MTVLAALAAPPERDVRIPPIVPPEYEAYPRVVLLGDQLIIFRTNHYVSCALYCVARLPSGERCATYLTECGMIQVAIVGTDAQVSAGVSSLPDECYTRQRCLAHVHSGGDDVVAPTGQPFDLARDGDALSYTAPRWSPEGVWMPPEHGHRMRISSHHAAGCAAGAHVPFADDTYEDEEDGDGWETANPRAGRHPMTEKLLASRPKRAAKAEPEPPELAPFDATGGPTALYRYFDIADLLLYAGISDRLRMRTGDHVKGSSWMDFAVRSTIERFPSREIALEAEEQAIKAEHPLFNHQHNNTPEARRRLVEYLVSQDRLDLLAPAVSRG